MAVIVEFSYLLLTFAIGHGVLCAPCLNLRVDKNDGLKIFDRTGGIGASSSSRLKREIGDAPGELTVSSGVDDVLSRPNKMLGRKRRSLQKDVGGRIGKDVLERSVLINRLDKRDASNECPQDWGLPQKLGTGTDFYSRKPSDVKTVESAVIKTEGTKNKTTENVDEEMAIAESNIVFRPFFAYKQKLKARQKYLSN